MFKRILSVSLAVLLCAAILSACGMANTQVQQPAAQPGNDPTAVQTAETSADLDDLNIRMADWSEVQWTPYSSDYFTLSIPNGWQVNWQGDANRLFWAATSPDGTVGISNLDHNYAVKDEQMKELLGFDLYLSQGTVQEYFETQFAESTEYFTVQNSCVPADKEKIQQVRPNTAIRDYQALYAIFSENGMEGEGVYSAVIMDSPDVVMHNMNYGVWEINGIFTQWAPRGELVSWWPVLKQICASFAYTDRYIQEWMAIAQSSVAPTSPVDDTDPVMEAFEERSRSDTIIQEKRSDMIGEYERVYDNETGGIYRAYNGFLDDIGSDQTRYTPITDDQYTEGYVGWIDK